jgi:DNA-binding XRE family transcriptional regulator
MAGRYITKQQVNLYMKYRDETTLTKAACAAKAGISVKSAYSIEKGKHHTFNSKKVRAYKTRKSEIDDVWNNELSEMLKANPELQPKTLLIHLQRTYLDDNNNPIYKNSVLRTLQRRVANWQALNGKDKDVFFPQTHLPGVQSLSDFTHMDRSEILINGTIFKHMLYQLRLVYSKWSYVKVIQTGESFQALSEGLQEALSILGGSTKEHRTDSLSAAFKNLTDNEKKDITERYEELCSHYNMQPTRNNKGVSHENGSIESSHGHLKNRIAQELILRGSNEFASVAAYEDWVQEVVSNCNRRNSKNFAEEKSTLQPLPAYKTADYEVISAKVSKLSMMVIKNMTYSMPSRLSGHVLTTHIYQNKIDCYLGSSLVASLVRKYRTEQESRYVIDYRHIIHALIKKPRAFRFCKYRDEILPNSTYKAIWEYVDSTESRDVASKIMLRILKLASDYDCEHIIGQRICNMIANNKHIDIKLIECEFNGSNPHIPMVSCDQHSIDQYDYYIPSLLSMEVSHAAI